MTPDVYWGCEPPPSLTLEAGFVVNSEKLPCVPRRSGVHIAESWWPSNSSGGNVMGTRRMVLRILRSPRIFQNVRLFRRNSIVGSLNGIRRRPSFQTRRTGRTFEDESSGT